MVSLGRPEARLTRGIASSCWNTVWPRRPAAPVMYAFTGGYGREKLYKLFYTYFYYMTPKRRMGKCKQKKTSRPPADPAKAKKRGFDKLSNALEDALEATAKNTGMAERSIMVSRETVRMIPIQIKSAEDMKMLLAAKALGLMQCMRKGEREAFLGDAAGRVDKELNKHSIPLLFVGSCKEEKTALDQEVNAAGTIHGFSGLARKYFDAYYKLCDDDVSPITEEADYYTTHWVPISEGRYGRAVIYARLADLSVEPEKKLEYLENEGVRYRQDWKSLELFDKMRKVYQVIADFVGRGATVATSIRKNATDLMDRHFSKGELKEKEGFELYRECKEWHDKLKPHAENVAAALMTEGVLPEMLRKLEGKFGLKIRLESQTSNPDEIYRIKGPAGIFWKVRRKRKRGEPDYGIGDIQDFIGTTAVVYGNEGDVRKIADWIRIGLLQSRAKFSIDRIAIKDEERETGYRASHIVFEIKVDGVAVPAEIQVRTKEMHEEAKLGRFSHAFKEAGISSGEHRRIMEKIAELMGGEFRKAEEIYETQKTERRKVARGRKKDVAIYRVTVLDLRKRRAKQEHLSVKAKNKEVVGGIVVLAIGFGNKVKVTDASMEGENGLDFFGECPQEITITVEKGKGPGRDTCDELLKGKVLTPNAVEAIQEYKKTLKRKRRRRN
ncbi:hypothetical protein GF412_03720 [Candidatus Micrarchaeota archaeon]|nr:hypothetical protein [Candidatus Micrarchaeota archaeon]MBD3418058.1 hypothetical protein [Candidatus Micrarchaeota archaeon]